MRLLVLTLLMLPLGLRAQCFGTFQYPPFTVVADDNGAPITISTCSFAGDHAVVSLLAGRTYRFTSSVATDHITVSSAVGTGALVYGTQPVLFTATTTQDHYVHFHTDPACGTQNVCRTTQVQRVYCLAGTFSCGGADESITRVTFGAIDNLSGGCGGGGYSDFSAQATSIFPGQTRQVTVMNSAPYSGDQVHVFVDWDRNFNYGDPGETFILSTADNITFSGTISSPSSASPGSAGMRVRLTYTGLVPTCGFTFYGEVEDYTLNVLPVADAMFAGGNGRGDAVQAHTPLPIFSSIYGGGAGRGDAAQTHLPTPILSSIYSGGVGRGDVAQAHLPAPIFSSMYSGGVGRGDVSAFIDPSTLNVVIALKGVLEGPYSPSTGLMGDALRTLPGFPLTEPYTGLGYAHAGGGGSETVAPAVLAVTGNNAIVDWVVVELRDNGDPTIVLSSRCALLQRDGDVVDADGVSPVTFGQLPGTYRVALRHRNHLGIVTLNSMALGSTPLAVDLSLPATATFGTNARKSLTGTFPTQALWSGDVTFNGQVKYTGAGNDRDPILSRIGGSSPTATVSGYWREDCNLDGTVKYTGSGNDRDPILLNIGGSSPTNTRNAQLP